jgi:hypothetical protein
MKAVDFTLQIRANIAFIDFDVGIKSKKKVKSTENIATSLNLIFSSLYFAKIYLFGECESSRSSLALCVNQFQKISACIHKSHLDSTKKRQTLPCSPLTLKSNKIIKERIISNPVQ